MAAKVYDGTQIDYEYDLGKEDARLKIDCEYYTREGFAPEGFDPGEPDECELMSISVASALIGPNLREATEEECKALTREIRKNPVEMGLIEDAMRRKVL